MVMATVSKKKVRKRKTVFKIESERISNPLEKIVKEPPVVDVKENYSNENFANSDNATYGLESKQKLSEAEFSCETRLEHIFLPGSSKTSYIDDKQGIPHSYSAILDPSISSLKHDDSIHSDYQNRAQMANYEEKVGDSKFCEVENKKMEGKTIRLDPVFHDLLKPFESLQILKVTKCKAHVQTLMLTYRSKITEIRKIETKFLGEVTEKTFYDPCLFSLLDQYFQIRLNVMNFLIDVKTLRQQIKINDVAVWEFEQKSEEFLGKCGHNSDGKGFVKYETACINQDNLENVIHLQKQFKHLLLDDYVSSLLRGNALKVKIDDAIDQIIFTIVNFKFSGKYMEVNKNDALINNLHKSISTLFFFIRKPCKDKELNSNLRKWLLKLAALQLRIGTEDDCLFLLHHLLRCPSGISWGTPMIQIPTLHHFNVKFCLAVLNTIMCPVEKRMDFLKPLLDNHNEISGPCSEEIWMLVDSEGEEGNIMTEESIRLRENDMIALLNQIPFEKLFCEVFRLKTENNTYHIPAEIVTETFILEILSVNTITVEILGAGIRTYGTDRYKQFVKRLGLLIKHCLNYCADYYQLFINVSKHENCPIHDHLKEEFEHFVLLSCKFLYEARGLGTWQYFTTIPFSILSTATIWRMFYLFNVGFSHEIRTTEDYYVRIQEAQFLKDFNINIEGVPDADLFYLMQTFSEMALERDLKIDPRFFEVLCHHILYVGFLNENTQQCFKICRDMLVTLTSKYPALISTLVNTSFAANIEFESFEYVFSSFTVRDWTPNFQCVELLRKCLIYHPCASKENKFARYLIDRLNWGINLEKTPFLPYELHLQTAFILCEAAAKHSRESSASYRLSGAVSSVSDLFNAQFSEKHFLDWCWKTMYKLRLHQLDLGAIRAEALLNSPSTVLATIPDLNDIKLLLEEVSATNPLAIFAAISITLWGHSTSSVCENGFEQLELLLRVGKNFPVIRCLQFITLLFVDTPRMLYTNERFVTILNTLLTVDCTYIKMATSILFDNFEGSTIDLLEKMIQSQILNHKEYGLTSPVNLIKLWLKCLLRLSNLHKSKACHLIEILIKGGYPFVNTWKEAKSCFREMLIDSKIEVSSRSSIMDFFRLKSKSQVCTLPWTTLLITEVEFETFEMETNLWPVFLRECGTSPSSSSLNNSFKRALETTGSSERLLNELAIFKYADIILNLNYKHMLLPIVFQQFFKLYLAKINKESTEGENHHYFGLTNLFFNHNVSIVENLRKVLENANKYYKKEAENADHNNVYFNKERSRLFTAYLLWLDDNSLNIIRRSQHINLPDEFYTDKLYEIFDQTMEEHWTCFLQAADLVSELQSGSRYYSSFFGRTDLKNISHSAIYTRHRNNLERIVSNLLSYDKPLDAPELKIEPYILVNTDEVFDKCCCILKSMENDLKILSDLSRTMKKVSQDFNKANEDHITALKMLYKNIEHMEIIEVTCTYSFTKSFYACTNPGKISAKAKKPVKDLIAQKRMETSDCELERLIEIIFTLKLEMVDSALQRNQYLIRYLFNPYNPTSSQSLNITKLLENAKIAFYKCIGNYNDEIISCAPVDALWKNIANTLKNFLKPKMISEGVHILRSALENSNVVEFVDDLIAPQNCYFVKMYTIAIESSANPIIIYRILLKFDIHDWLKSYGPSVDEIRLMGETIFLGLENSTMEVKLQEILKQHLIIIFEFKIPTYCQTIFDITLASCLKSKISKSIIIDLVNSLLFQSSVQLIKYNSSKDFTYQQIELFAKSQNLFSFKELTEIIEIFRDFFKTQRFKAGLHGLYPKFSKYCDAFAILFALFGEASIISAKLTNSNESENDMCVWIFTTIIEVYSPWVLTYTENDVAGSSVLREVLSTDRVLYPWSDIYSSNAETIIESLAKCLQYSIDASSAPNLSIGCLFEWYNSRIAGAKLPEHISSIIHKYLSILQWKYFYPTSTHLEMLSSIVHALPDDDLFIPSIFLEIPWTNWYNEHFSLWNVEVQKTSINYLFTIFAKLPLKSTICQREKTANILNSSLSFSWNMVSTELIEHVFDWLMIISGPTVVQKFGETDRDIYAISFRLIRIACGFHHGSLKNSSYSDRTKRSIYIRGIIRMLQVCKNKQLANFKCTTDSASVIEVISEILSNIEKVALYEENEDDRNAETLILIVNVLNVFSSEENYIDRLIIDSMIAWQSERRMSKCVTKNLINAIGIINQFESHMYILLESSLCYLFKLPDLQEHNLSWEHLTRKLGKVFEHLDCKALIQRCYLLSLHVAILYNMNSHHCDKNINFLSDTIRLLQSTSINGEKELDFVLVWGAITCAACKFFTGEEAERQTIFMLAKHLENTSEMPTNLASGLLSLVGLRRNTLSEKYKLTLRCFSFLAFSLITDRKKFSEIENRVLPTSTYQDEEMKKLQSDAIIIVKSSAFFKISIISAVIKLVKMIYPDNLFSKIGDVWAFE